MSVVEVNSKLLSAIAEKPAALIPISPVSKTPKTRFKF